MSRTGFGIPDAVSRKARALGASGDEWLHDLGATVVRLADAWGITVGEVLPGGSAALVTAAATGDGIAAVLKVALPDGLDGNGSFEREVEVLTAAGGRGYVGVLAVDATARAVLLEQLGRPLSARALGVEQQIDHIAATLRHAWSCPPPPGLRRTGSDQAAFLADFIVRKWEQCGHPCPRATVDAALLAVASRADAFDAAGAVMIHGDAHPGNVLEELDDGRPSGRFKLIDPDPMVSEPAHELGVPLRDWSDELLAGDPVRLGRGWCERAGRAGGADPQAIWEWALTERVSTGLFMLSLGDGRGGALLRVAERWTGAAGPR